ncbi:MAG: PAS domain S-box-containing protein [Candidatus Nitrotoga sp. LAW]|nr:MAG: PAS domain S-box-containing protein [Candidatus Nitrotoga sp. LAW]
MKISRHLLLLFLLVSVMPLVVFGYINLQQNETTLRAEVLGRMAALAAKKATEVKSYLAERLQNVRYLALDPRVTEEMNYLSKTYATNLSTAARYTSESARTHQYFDRYIEKMGLLYDVFLITPQGEIVYTQKHESDFATNLLDGPYRNTQLAQAFRNVRATLEPVISGYEDYAPSNRPAMFIAAPIMIDGQFKGVFAVQLGNELFYRVAKDTVGLGVSGEAMFAQWDGDSALFTVPTRNQPDAAMRFKLNLQQVKNAPMFEALSGEAGAGIRTDYRGKRVVAAWRYLPELEWGMVIKVDADEAFAFLNQQRVWSFGALVLVILSSAMAAFYFGRKLVVPLQELAIGAAEVAQGNLGRRVSEKGVDEISLLAHAFNRMTQNLQSLYDSLEQRVTKRTQELDAANQRLMEEIHVRKRTEQEILIMSQKLRESSRLLEAIVEHIPVMVFVKRASDLRIELFNRAGVEQTGYTQETVIGKSDYDLWPKEQGDFFTAADRKVLASHEVMEIPEEPITRANGEIRTLQTWKIALRDEGGNPTHLLGISIDISERKKAERGLQLNEQRLKNAQRIAKLGNWELDFLSNQLIWSDETFRIFELDKAQFSATYESFLNAIHPDDREAVRTAYTRSLETKEDYAIDHRLLFPDGRIKYVHEQCQTVFSETGQPLRSLGTVQDITEHKHAKLEILKLNAELEERVIERTDELELALSALRIEEENIAVTLSSIGDAVLSTDIDGRVTRLNYVAEQLTGWTHAEAAGHCVNEILHIINHKTREPMVIPISDALAKGVFHNLTSNKILIARNGNEYPITDSCAPIRNREGSVIGLVVVFRDVTEEYAAQAALCDSTTRLETIIDTVADGIITINENGTVETMNCAVERIFGYAAAEVVGQNIKMLMPEPDYSQHDGHLDRYRATGEAHIIGSGREVTGQRKDGSIFPLELAVNEMWLGGRRHFTGVLRDITARKQADELLQNAKEAAESANRSKSDFLAVMSHEIRTPMNGVIGMLDVLTQTSLNGHQAEMARLIRESAYILLGIIEDILDFSKIEAGKLELEQECLSIEDVVEKASSMFDYMAQHKQIELTLFVDPEIPNVLGDALRLHQILTNLINNALKFSNVQNRLGQVMVRVRISRREAGRVWLEFTVRDNGIGMDEATQSRLFTPFEQADSSTKRLFGGTGLGLAISRQLVHMMAGEISVQSELGVGSTFTVYLPFEVVPQSEMVHSPVDGLPCLLIGHDTGLTADIAAQLTYAGAQVQRVADIDAAQHADVPTDPIWIWILDTLGAPSLLNELRAISCLYKQIDIRLFLIGRGNRRRPRQVADDLVWVDSNLLTRRIILQAVAIAAGRAKDETSPKLVGLPCEAFEAPSRDEGVHQGKLILVVEDNEINQQVIRRQLALLGFASEVSGDGREALNRWKTGEYALLLTDVHMPHMDGYELTAAIRAEEKTGISHTPIIALTANALKDEEKYCKAAGMDDYLSKPVRLTNLKMMLEKWMPLAKRCSIASQVKEAIERPIDVRVLQDLVGNDTVVINELLQDFSVMTVSIATGLNTDYAAGQLVEVGTAAHKMKSSARSIGAYKLGELCEQIEHTCNDMGESAALAELMSHFNEEMAVVENYLATWTYEVLEPESNKRNA